MLYAGIRTISQKVVDCYVPLVFMIIYPFEFLPNMISDFVVISVKTLMKNPCRECRHNQKPQQNPDTKSKRTKTGRNTCKINKQMH